MASLSVFHWIAFFLFHLKITGSAPVAKPSGRNAILRYVDDLFSSGTTFEGLQDEIEDFLPAKTVVW
jgi:hypothetical protein